LWYWSIAGQGNKAGSDSPGTDAFPDFRQQKKRQAAARQWPIISRALGNPIPIAARSIRKFMVLTLSSKRARCDRVSTGDRPMSCRLLRKLSKLHSFSNLLGRLPVTAFCEAHCTAVSEADSQAYAMFIL